MHPVIARVLEAHTPKDAQTLHNEDPQISNDGVRVAYKLKNHPLRQVTTPGRYLKRHFPNLTDNLIRDFTTHEVFHWTEDFITPVIEGPQSCMSTITTDPHPYAVYTPENGWRMAVAMQNGKYTGRALVHGTTFVRSYSNAVQDGRNQTHHPLEAWLASQGIEKKHGYPEGSKLLAIPHGGEDCIVPYIDGLTDRVTLEDNFLILSQATGVQASSQDGWVTLAPSSSTCDQCGDPTLEDDLYQVCDSQQEENLQICRSCRNNHYTYAIGRGGESCWIHVDDTTGIGGVDYVNTFIEENGFVSVNGDYFSPDDVTYVEGLNGYVLDEDVHQPQARDATYVWLNGGVHPTDNLYWCEYLQQYAEEVVELANGTYVTPEYELAYLYSKSLEDLAGIVHDLPTFTKAYNHYHAVQNGQKEIEYMF